MMQIKEIPNGDFLHLAALNAKMYEEIDITINAFGATNTLIHAINTKQDFKAIGLYDDHVLVGFVTGFNLEKKTFHFSGIYVTMKNNAWTKKLIEFCFALIKDKGYSAWTVDATNGNISSIMEKYGAKAKYTRYCKELL